MMPSSPLLRLPREIRDQIVGYVFEDVEPHEKIEFKLADTQDLKRVDPTWDHLPHICHASMQLYHETTPAFLSHVTPVLQDVETICWMRKWLKSFAYNAGFRAIKQLSFRNFYGPEQIKGHELIALCPNLRHIDITFGDEFSNHVPGNSWDWKREASHNPLESLDEMIRSYQLNDLLAIPKLERFSFEFFQWDVLVSPVRARQLIEWLQIGFAAKGKMVQIECDELRRYDEESEEEEWMYACIYE